MGVSLARPLEQLRCDRLSLTPYLSSALVAPAAGKQRVKPLEWRRRSQVKRTLCLLKVVAACA